MGKLRYELVKKSEQKSANSAGINIVSVWLFGFWWPRNQKGGTVYNEKSGQDHDGDTHWNSYLSYWELINSGMTGRETAQVQTKPLNVGDSCMVGSDCWATGIKTRIYPTACTVVLEPIFKILFIYFFH